VIVEALLGAGASSYKVLFAVVAVVVLLALAVWALRRFGSSRLRGAAARGRQPRLAVIDSAAVDGRRRLLLIRRDNVEHLIMIGGPTDVVVEQNILRATTAAREVAPARGAAAAGAADTLPRPAPLGEASLWPLQPEPAQKVEPTLRAEPRAEPPRPETPPPGAPVRERKPRATDPLAGLAEELSRVAPAGNAGSSERPATRRVLRPQPTAGDGDAKSTPPASSAPPAPDQNLSEMAQRLEAAMRRPARSLDKAPEKSDSGRPAEAAPVKPASEAAPAGQPAAPQKSAYDNLEEEMASLLGRPTGKS
jgi:flagellar protein FliO/FliZ